MFLLIEYFKYLIMQKAVGGDGVAGSKREFAGKVRKFTTSFGD